MTDIKQIHDAPHRHLPECDLAFISLAEECNEVSIEAMKALRFTPHGVCSMGPQTGTTPLERLAGEIGDVLGCIDFLKEHYPELDQAVIEARRLRRPARIRHFNNPENW